MTSGSMTAVACSGAGSARSMGMLTCVNAVTSCAHAVLEDLEVVAFQVADEAALPIEDRGVDLDVVDLDLEGDLRLGRQAVAGGCCARSAAPAVTARASPSTIRRVAFIGRKVRSIGNWTL